MEKLIYRCKSCGWEKAIPAQWADISPRYCGNNKCEYSGRKKSKKNSFMKTPSMLEIEAPVKKSPKVESHEPEKSEKIAKESEYSDKSEKRRSRRKKSRG